MANIPKDSTNRNATATRAIFALMSSVTLFTSLKRFACVAWIELEVPVPETVPTIIVPLSCVDTVSV
jgi:hypothetical protein